MKKYIVPTITVEKIELTNLMAASPLFSGGEGLPTAGISSEKGSTADDLPTLGTTKGETPDLEQPGHEAEGYSKSFNIWE